MYGTEWLYEHADDASARFVLGTTGSRPLVCFGINPSTAKPNDLDLTVGRVRAIAASEGFDSWIMLNVYPQIATDPDGMDRDFAPDLKVENERHITAVIQGKDFTLLAAWGVLIDKRLYLRSLLQDILALPPIVDRPWMSLGSTRDGHPRHPSRLPGGTRLQPFSVDRYR